jgi:hypothetical protein
MYIYIFTYIYLHIYIYVFEFVFKQYLPWIQPTMGQKFWEKKIAPVLNVYRLVCHQDKTLYIALGIISNLEMI